MIMIRGTYGTMYYVNDMAKAVTFYKDVLKLKTRFESPEWTEFDVNGQGLCLHITDPQMKPLAAPGLGTLIVDVKGLTPMVDRMKKQGVEFLGPIKEVHPGAYSTEFKDPQGNIVSLYEDTSRK
jgi:predicted enzyme related to lactoylglutathione lyase